MSRTSEVIEVTDSRAVEAEPSSERAAAFLRLADEHLDAACRLARAILRDPTEAQDATHDAVVQAWSRWSSLRDPARFEAAIRSIRPERPDAATTPVPSGYPYPLPRFVFELTKGWDRG